jgi:hypothetical protein
MILEALLMVYFLFGMYSAIPLNDFGLFNFNLIRRKLEFQKEFVFLVNISSCFEN